MHKLSNHSITHSIIDSLWIGDWIQHSKNLKVGRYEGKKEKKARVKVKEKILLWPFEQIRKLTEKEVVELEKELIRERNRKSKTTISNANSRIDFTSELDLHIDKLAPHLEGKRAEVILLHQLRKSREFIETAIAKRQLSITLIHGIGSGALKMEIDHMLKDYDEIYFKKEVNRGGAVEVLFRY